jgi:S1-C subfamily serine protease
MDAQAMYEATIRYLRNEMPDGERTAFEELRKQNPEIDQMVVEQHYFIGQLESYGDMERFKASLHDIHHNLSESGEIRDAVPSGKATVIQLWQRYRRVVAVAASIAGVTALLISGLTAAFGPNAPKRDMEELRRKVTNLEKQTNNQNAAIDAVRNKIDPATPIKFGGTGFLIDGKGYLVTSAHVVDDATRIFVQDGKGADYRAEVLHRDIQKDLAILRISDEDFKPIATLPYGISRTTTDLAEPVFTMGYPKDEIVYGEGYLSAKSGLKGDTLAYQVSLSANPGNSGGPVLNRRGEVIGVLNARQTKAEGVVFAVKSRHLLKIVDDLKNSSPEPHVIRIPAQSSIRNLDRIQQVKRIQDHVYMVKVVL